MTKLILLLLVVLFPLMSSGQDLESFYEEYYEWQIKSKPFSAYSAGLQYDDLRMNNYSYLDYQEYFETAKNLREKFNKIYNANGVTRYMDILKYELDSLMEHSIHKGYLLAPITPYGGLTTSLPNAFKENDTLLWASADDFGNNLARLVQIPDMLKNVKELLERGVEDGITFAKETLDMSKGPFEKLQKDGGENITNSDFYQMFSRKDFSKQVAAEYIENKILPAYKELEEYIFGDYYKHARLGPGVLSFNNLKGQDFYQACLKYYTTKSEVKPEELHSFGYESLNKSQSRLKELAIQLGYADSSSTFKSAVNAINDDKDLYFETEDEVINAYKQEVENIKPKLATVFETKILTEKLLNVDVKPTPPGTAGIAYYEAGTPDGRRDGVFYVNSKTAISLIKGMVATFTLHEGAPGHHMQITYRNDLDIPKFVRYSIGSKHGVPSMVQTNGAFKQGWGLYSEYLGYELGVYENEPMKEIGYLNNDLLRSARLIVDTGIHHFGWTTENAIKFLRENTALSMIASEREIKRYITMPGQAVSYKVGEREIHRLRKKFTNPDDFEMTLKKFHTAVLNCEGPIELLEACISEYVNGNEKWGGWSSNTKKDSSHKFKPLGQKDKNSQTFSSSTPKPTTTSRPISTTEPATYNSGGLADGCPRNGANPSTIQIPSLSETAAVNCCSNDEQNCIRPRQCFQTNFTMAQQKCKDIGRRLCTLNELSGNKCCETGCAFDDKLTWYAKEETISTTTPTTTTTTANDIDDYDFGGKDILEDRLACFDQGVAYLFPESNKISTIHNVESPKICQEYCIQDTECRHWTFVRKTRYYWCKLLNGLFTTGYRNVKSEAISGTLLDGCNGQEEITDFLFHELTT